LKNQTPNFQKMITKQSSNQDEQSKTELRLQRKYFSRKTFQLNYKTLQKQFVKRIEAKKLHLRTGIKESHSGNKRCRYDTFDKAASYC